MHRQSLSSALFIIALFCTLVALASPASARDSWSATRVTFLGISSFLVEESPDTLLIDGFFSRTGLLTVKKVEPNAERIEAVLESLCILTLGSAETTGPSSPCLANQRKQLSYVLPLHGHFDHALDSAYIAARTGAALVTDASGLRIQAATQRRFEPSSTAFDWTVPPVLVNDLKPHKKQTVPFGNHDITLFYVPHAWNLIYPNFARITDDKFKFRSNIFQLGEGLPLAAHIRTPSGDMLIVASPEMPPNKLADVELKADVVFLSLGGLGLKSRETIAEYFSSAVLAGGARRVYPIHWDKGQTALVPKPHALKPMFPRLHRQVLNVISELATACGVEFHQIPIAITFDPFQDIPDQAPTPDAPECLQALTQDK